MEHIYIDSAIDKKVIKRLNKGFQQKHDFHNRKDKDLKDRSIRRKRRKSRKLKLDQTKEAFFRQKNNLQSQKKNSYKIVKNLIKCGTLRDFVAFVQFRKREKQPWRSVNFKKVVS